METIKHNIMAVVLMLSAYFMIDSVGRLSLSEGSVLFLPLGAQVLAYLIFGYRVLPGIVAANFLVGCLLWNDWFGNGFYGFFGHVLFGSVAPIMAIYLMRSMHLSDFFKEGQINFRHIIFLILLTALISTLGKFFIYTNHIVETFDPVHFLWVHLVGGMLGGLVFVVLALKMLPLFTRSF